MENNFNNSLNNIFGNGSRNKLCYKNGDRLNPTLNRLYGHTNKENIGTYSMPLGVDRARIVYLNTRACNTNDDFYLNPLTSADDIFASAYDRKVYVYSIKKGSMRKVACAYKSNKNHVASVHLESKDTLSVGLYSGHIHRVDLETCMRVCDIYIGDDIAVSCMSVKDRNVIASSGPQTWIDISDVRSRHVSYLRDAHDGRVCALKWSQDGVMLASGSNDDTLKIWDSRSFKTPIKIYEFKSAVKAMDWYPWNNRVIAAGGGYYDSRIRMFNVLVNGNKDIKCIETGTQVSSLFFSKETRAIISAHTRESPRTRKRVYSNTINIYPLGKNRGRSRVCQLTDMPIYMTEVQGHLVYASPLGRMHLYEIKK